MIKEIKNIDDIKSIKLSDVSQIYIGKDKACRCGCLGYYISTSYMLKPRSEVDDKQAQELLDQSIEFVIKGFEIECRETLVNIKIGSGQAITIYLNELKEN